MTNIASRDPIAGGRTLYEVHAGDSRNEMEITGGRVTICSASFSRLPSLFAFVTPCGNGVTDLMCRGRTPEWPGDAIKSVEKLQPSTHIMVHYGIQQFSGMRASLMVNGIIDPRLNAACLDDTGFTKNFHVVRERRLTDI
jgi:hypothetical protein